MRTQRYLSWPSLRVHLLRVEIRLVKNSTSCEATSRGHYSRSSLLNKYGSHSGLKPWRILIPGISRSTICSIWITCCRRHEKTSEAQSVHSVAKCPLSAARCEAAFRIGPAAQEFPRPSAHSSTIRAADSGGTSTASFQECNCFTRRD